MNCKKCRKQLHDYRDKTLDSFQREDVEKHLEICPACLEAYHSEAELAREFQQWAAGIKEHPSFTLHPSTLLGGYKPWSGKGKAFQVLSWGTAVATVLLVILFGKHLLFSPLEKSPGTGPTVAMKGGMEVGLHDSRHNGAGGNELIQVISMEDESGQWSETNFRQESAGLVTNITVEVTSVRLLNQHLAHDRVLSR